ncbi:glycosyltransferase [Pseudanabaena sp. FACHB-2040]|uniref:glycosyltransferase family 2 protein n=1 Tax=Pseudanabaena sp. FACHB-2040 TaxID=2692859 RepID=UPI001685D661|nr:glycosyltransferase [Pseudanabaena sp. FACHB-2040]MBD2260579.1 glycosyltransferase family 2 protein [Pseudanabaena sp. FACHB-2040]
MLSFAAVVCTYNRYALLEQSLSHWSQASRLPDQFIVVDATENAASYRDRLVEKFPQLFSQPESQYIVTDRPGLTRQRNVGLDAVKTDIVCFADDDTFITPSYIDKILEVFEKDTAGSIGGVNGVAEGQFDNWPQRTYREFRNYVRHHYGGQLQRIHLPQHYTHLFDPIPTPLKALPLIHIDRLWGANMNYRTEALKGLRFDENFQRYGLFEDVDLSIQVGQRYKLVCRLDAELSHDFKLGESTRPNDAKYFLFSWLNSAYIIEKLLPYDESRQAHRNLFNLTRFLAKAAPKRLSAGRLKTLGNDPLISSAEQLIKSLQACNSKEQLEETFVHLQREVSQVDRLQELVNSP